MPSIKKRTTKTRKSDLRRLAVVFAVEIRLKIVTELFMREMSPKQFHDEFGGGTLSRVARNFQKLAADGWLEHTRTEGPGGSRRGGVEHFYRAKEPAFFAPDAWAQLPLPVRVAFSWNSFKEIAGRLRTALETQPFGSDNEHSLTSISLSMDERGWERVIGAVRERFDRLFEEQDAARKRMARSGEKPIRASVVQMAFECSPGESAEPRFQLVENSNEPLVPLPVRLSQIFGDDLYLRIIEAASQRAISATEFHAEFGGDSPEGIRRRFRKLAQVGWLRQVDRKTGGKRRGAVEKYYRTTGPAIHAKGGPWANVSASLRASSHWGAFEALSAEVKASMGDGTFDARDDSCLAWSLLQLDQVGSERIGQELEDLLALALDEQELAAARLERSGESPIPMTVALAAFESPKEAEGQL